VENSAAEQAVSAAAGVSLGKRSTRRPRVSSGDPRALDWGLDCPPHGWNHCTDPPGFLLDHTISPTVGEAGCAGDRHTDSLGLPPRLHSLSHRTGKSCHLLTYLSVTGSALASKSI